MDNGGFLQTEKGIIENRKENERVYLHKRNKNIG